MTFPILVGPKTDTTLEALSLGLVSKGIRFHRITNLEQLQFVYRVTNNKVEAEVRTPDGEWWNAGGLSMVLRHPHLLVEYGSTREERFLASERIAALTSLCTTIPNLINPPLMSGWAPSHLRRACSSHSPAAEILSGSWRAIESASIGEREELHVEDLATSNRWIWKPTSSATRANSPGGTAWRAYRALSSRYNVYLCVDDWVELIVDELGRRQDVELTGTLSVELARKAGLRFFAAIIGESASGPFLAQIITEPTCNLYVHHQKQVHERLSAALAGV